MLPGFLFAAGFGFFVAAELKPKRLTGPTFLTNDLQAFNRLMFVRTLVPH